MTANVPLLNILALQAGCTYLSDLRYLDALQRLRLARSLESFRAEDADLAEWNEALAYLAGEHSVFSSAEQGRQALIAALSRPDGGRL